MGSTKKGNTWHFGVKPHISVDANSSLVHTVGITTASDHGSSIIGKLVREDDFAVFGDKGYASDNTKPGCPATDIVSNRLYWTKRNCTGNSPDHKALWPPVMALST